VLAAELPPSVAHLHAHFLHTPASVARYAALIRGLSWSVSAHAKDIWTTPDWEKREKLAEADWAVTCTADGLKHLAALAPSPGAVELVYHGLDLARFAPPPADTAAPANAPLRLLSVGRAVEKKGYADLLAALALLPADLEWRFTHIGGGELKDGLREQARHLGLAGRIDWLGPQPQPAVLAQYRAADIFVLASRIAADGDRDGLPNVLMEAQSQRLCCVASRVAAVPELIEHERTGVLVEPGDVDGLAAALARLARDPARRRALGRAGAERVRSRFGHEAGIDRLAERLGWQPTGTEETQARCASFSMHR
jgi:glycosyltransferase involved in cell wall biosynthesis